MKEINVSTSEALKNWQADRFHPLENCLGKDATVQIPTKFPSPFLPEVHPIALMAAEELKFILNGNFTSEKITNEEGKMFGILVVKNAKNDLGYLAAFSGFLSGSYHYPGFVPPLVDLLGTDGFYWKGMAKLDAMNEQIETLENSAEHQEAIEKIKALYKQAKSEIEEARAALKSAKQARAKQRLSIETSKAEHGTATLLDRMNQESQNEKKAFKDLKKKWEMRIFASEEMLKKQQNRLSDLKKQRKKASFSLQNEIFSKYVFLNAEAEKATALDLFEGKLPPSGTGDCAAPKLLQFAFQNHLQPVALAEFWWGAAPKSELRRHGELYPACRGKCLPILSFMLKGLAAEPFFDEMDFSEKKVKVLFEDDYLAVIEKPAGLPSVKGKMHSDCVEKRLPFLFPHAEKPMLAHRLDMDTSGLMLVGKTEAVYKDLQCQFLKKTIQKRYSALLQNNPVSEGGTIDLPLRPDLDDRPRQMVCFEHGKSARTIWQKTEVRGSKALVHFFPITGRTHQLRVHAAHPQGLGIPIVGDRLYGKTAERLMLHAESIEFEHPNDRKKMRFEVLAEWA